MKSLPQTPGSLILRADFSKDAAWRSICTVIRKTAEFEVTDLEFVDNPAYAGLTAQEALSLIPQNQYNATIFVVDAMTLSHPEHPLLVASLADARKSHAVRTFRAVPETIGEIECNLSIGNISFEEYLHMVGSEMLRSYWKNDLNL